MKYEFGERIGKTAQLRVGAVGAVFDEAGRLLLTRRADNGEWCLPGGAVDPGETPAEACAREIREETGLDVRIAALLGVYSPTHLVITYPDGNRWQAMTTVFRAAPIGGAPTCTAEVTDLGYFTAAEAAALDVIPLHSRWLGALFNPSAEPFFD